jgi:hypothetical protein
MTFKPMTYLVSFALFVMLFMALGGYVAYGRIADHLLAQAFLEATSLNLQVVAEPLGPAVRWEDKVPLPRGGYAHVLASSRSSPISIRYSDEPEPAAQAALGERGILLTADERTEDLRIDKAGRFLYARVFAAATAQAKDTTWLYKFDVQGRRLIRRTPVNPAMLPPPFRP